MAQPVVTHSAVKSLYVGILLRVAWLGYTSAQSSLLRPLLELFADVFGPLSQRIAAGLFRHSMTCSSTRLTREGGQGKIHLDAQVLRDLKSSITLNNRTERPSLSWSCIKSIDQQ